MSQISRQGVALSVAASLMYGLIPWYLNLQQILDGNSVFFCRVASVFACLALWLGIKGKLRDLGRLVLTPGLFLPLLICALLNASQWWLFVWAPLNGYTKELSLGFFLLPLTMALAGRLVLKEPLTGAQQKALAIAALGVALETLFQGGLSWVTLAPALVFPAYFLLRRTLPVDTATGLLAELTVFLPPVLWGLSGDADFAQALSQPGFVAWLLGFALLATGSMLCYLAAARYLPFTLFGLLSYLEPTLLFLVAVLVLQEPFSLSQYASYGLVGLATLVVMLDTLRRLRHQVPVLIDETRD